jgi:hypothetical protein
VAAVTHHLVGLAEIAELLEVSVAKARRLAAEDPQFPVPEANLRIGQVWATADVERWRDERSHRPDTRRLNRTDYRIDLAGFDRMERPQARIVRLEVEVPGRIMPFERHLSERDANRILGLLGEEAVTPKLAECSLRWAFAHQAAAALGRELERARSLDPVVAAKPLAKGQVSRVVAAARQAAEHQLDDIKIGTVLRVSAF